MSRFHDQMSHWESLNLRKNKVKLLRRYKACTKCGSKESLTIDHVIPISKGGHPYKMGNLQVLCEKCNIRKGSIITSTLVINGECFNTKLEVARNNIYHNIDQRVKSKWFNKCQINTPVVTENEYQRPL